MKPLAVRSQLIFGVALLALVAVPAMLSCTPNSPTTITPTTTIAPTSAPGTNDRVGDKLVFRQDYSSMSAIPNNVYLATNSEPYVTANATLRYDSLDKGVRFDATQNPVGNLIVGGLSPALSTSVSLDLVMGRSNFNAEANIRAGNAWLLVSIRDGSPSDTLRIRSYYYDPKLSYVQSDTPNIGTDNYAKFKVTIVSNAAEKTNTIFINGVKKITSPILWSAPDFSPSSYDSFMNPSIYFYFTLVIPGNSAYLELFSASQTIPEYRYITPISNPKLMPFGIDGPHAYEYVRNGLALMMTSGERGTIWADPVFIRDYSEQDMNTLKQLISNGWELGIHYYERLDDLSLADALAVMDKEYEIVKAKFGSPPTSWCSLSNADNATHADYAYSKLGMVWRNGKNGVEILSNIGNLDDDDWSFWAKTSAAGAVFPTFTHRLDSAPAIQFSVSPVNFSQFVQNYLNNGVQIVGYREYWDIVQNSYHSNISNLRFDKGNLLGFTLDNLGGNSRLFIATTSVKSVLDSQGNSVPFENADGGIVVEVHAGNYTLRGNSGS